MILRSKAIMKELTLPSRLSCPVAWPVAMRSLLGCTARLKERKDNKNY